MPRLEVMLRCSRMGLFNRADSASSTAESIPRHALYYQLFLLHFLFIALLRLKKNISVSTNSKL